MWGVGGHEHEAREEMEDHIEWAQYGNAKSIVYLLIGNKAPINVETFIKCFVLPYEDPMN